MQSEQSERSHTVRLTKVTKHLDKSVTISTPARHLSVSFNGVHATKSKSTRRYSRSVHREAMLIKFRSARIPLQESILLPGNAVRLCSRKERGDCMQNINQK